MRAAKGTNQCPTSRPPAATMSSEAARNISIPYLSSDSAHQLRYRKPLPALSSILSAIALEHEREFMLIQTSNVPASGSRLTAATLRTETETDRTTLWIAEKRRCLATDCYGSYIYYLRLSYELVS